MEPHTLFDRMVRLFMMRIGGVAFCLLLGLATPTSAQIDLSGTWASRLHEDWMERWPGPDAGDLTGLPINEAAVERARSYSPSLLALPERQCLFYGPSYTQIGPFGFLMWSEADPVDGHVVAWRMSGAVDKTPRAIWMDGRPHPSASALHTYSGFSTGRWEGSTLVVTTTHMKASPLRRNGVPTSDQAVMTEYFARYGDRLTVLSIIDDPVYLEEPYVLSRTYQEDPETVIAIFPSPCTPGVEAPGLAADAVPHYLPGQNPFQDQMRLYGLPPAALEGGASTLYPEFRELIEELYSRPEECGRYCCGWDGGNSGPNGGSETTLACVSREP